VFCVWGSPVANSALYAELTPRALAEASARAPIAYLPLGTLEWHGEHLPLGADGLQSQGFFLELAREAGGVVLPMLFVGPDRAASAGGRDYYGMDTFGRPEPEWEQLPGSAYWVPDGLFASLLEAILTQLRRAGFRVVVAHGHGPSTEMFRDRAPEWEQRFGLKLFVCWGGDEPEELGIQTDHAAANETSLVMALRPELVHMENLPEDPGAPLRAVAGRDPRQHASADLGRRAIRTQVKRMAGILRATLAELPAG
jgi:creatinine amidohydrolase